MSELTIVAPRGWWDLADADSFYPTDLPAEWQLSYFANAFGAVLLPHRCWAGTASDTLAQWREDVTPRFRFIAEAGGASPERREAEARLTQALGSSLSDWLSAEVSAASSSDETGHGKASAPKTFACWPAHADEAPGPESNEQIEPRECSRAGCASDYAVLAPGAMHADLRAARRWLDALLAEQGSAPAVIVLAHPRSGDLEAWQRLVELLGLMRDAG
jgi:hypothetical protein